MKTSNDSVWKKTFFSSRLASLNLVAVLFAGFSRFSALFSVLLLATATTQSFFNALPIGKFRQPSI